MLLFWLACAPMKRKWAFEDQGGFVTEAVEIEVVEARVKQKDLFVELRVTNPGDRELEIRLAEGSLSAHDGSSWPAFAASSRAGDGLSIVGVQARSQDLVLPPQGSQTFWVRAHQYGRDLRRYPRLELQLRMSVRDQILEPVVVLNPPEGAPIGQRI